ncbi:MAG TPA: tetratricopeptide repeat protein [Thermoanaerobaculia bacterium]|nr:tetratricopeptide repeat protein [Thermoanaerobaculia bacterium]
MSRDQLLKSADKHIARGRFDQALKEYLRVLDENPRDISTLNKVGDLYVRINRGSDSITYFTKIAEICSLDGFFLKAIAIYKKINKIDPARLDVYDKLGDLYAKQGLMQDARTQYQVLADHYAKNNEPELAIAAYRKMTAADPNDLKVQVRLADLYRGQNQLEQAVMQYGLVGSMLLRRGAQDEAGAVFQKALELSPQDAAARENLVRSLLAQKNPAAAMAILKAAPRTADSLALMAEAQFELGQRVDAARSAEQAIALEEGHAAARMALCKAHLAEADFEGALADVSPLVDAATAQGDFNRAAGYLSTILQIEEAHSDSLRKMAEVREAEGNAAEAARLRLALAREDERRGDAAAAIENYRKAAAAAPGHPEALSRIAELSRPGAPAPGPAPGAQGAPSAGPPPAEMVVDMDEVLADPGSATPLAALPGAPPAETPQDRELETLIVEGEIFARYGLTDKAVERLRAVVRKRPDLPSARERLLELMAASNNPALAQEAEFFAAFCRERGESARAEALLSKLGLSVPGAAPAAPAPPADAFEEFPVEPHPAAPPEFLDEFGTESIAFEAETATEPGTRVVPPVTPHAPEPTVAATEGEFVSSEGLDSLLGAKMREAGSAPEAPPQPAPAPAVDERSLFADEQQFFNLADELEKDLAEHPSQPAAPAMTGSDGDVSLEEIFREFKKGVEQQLSAEDYETHSNLGIAYKEMGLIDEAIGEFQLASKDPARSVECCSMLGLCFLEKGMPQLAIKWYRKGLETPRIKESETVGLLYDLAAVYQSSGDLENAYRTYLDVYGLDTHFRDVSDRVRELEAVRKD